MRVPLTGGAYEARSIIANAQRCVNLYPEINPGQNQPPSPVTHYRTPGLSLLSAPPVAASGRGCYRASNGQLFVVVGTGVYYVTAAWGFALLGSIAPGPTPVCMADNGTTILVVDGTAAGYTIDMATHAWGTIADPAFYGATNVQFSDTYFILNKPGTPIFYISGPNAVTWAPLDFAAKVGYADPLATLIVMHREVWLLGTLTTEIFYNSGAADFAFQQLPGAYIEHGCAAPYSVAKADLSVFWVSQDLQGSRMCLMGNNYAAKRVSTHAIETEWRTYQTVADAVAYTYQQDGHVFYVVTFPTADKTWAFDMATEQWHERTWTDPNGGEHRSRVQTVANAYGRIVAVDWENGNLYELALGAGTDNGDPIVRRRGFPHIVSDGKRVMYRQFIADMGVGGDTDPNDDPMVSLRWSDTRGATWSDPVEQSLGRTGQYATSIQFQRLGYARDRVFELFWDSDAPGALNGAFIDFAPAGT